MLEISTLSTLSAINMRHFSGVQSDQFLLPVSCICCREIVLSATAVNIKDCCTAVCVESVELGRKVFTRLYGDIPHFLLVESWTWSLSVVRVVCNLVHGSQP